jgi:hypothetical protein
MSIQKHVYITSHQEQTIIVVKTLTFPGGSSINAFLSQRYTSHEHPTKEILTSEEDRKLQPPSTTGNSLQIEGMTAGNHNDQDHFDSHWEVLPLQY